MNPHPTIELPVAEWKTALTGLSKVISKRTSLPVLEHLRVTRTAAGAVTLQVTDLDVTCTYQAAQPNAGEPCDFLVPFAPLHQAVKGSKETVQLIAETDGPIRLRTFIGASPMEQSFASLPVDEFPPAPVLTGRPVPLAAVFRDTLRQALDCCGEDYTRHILHHVCVDTRYPEGHYLTATNGQHLFCANSFQFDLKAPGLIPDRPFLRWNKFMEDGAIELSVQAPTKSAEPWVQLQSGSWTFLAKSSDLEFPNWRQVVPAPKRTRTHIQLDGGAVATLLAGVPRLPGGDALNRPVTLEIAGSTLLVKAKTKDAPDWTCLPVAGATITGKTVSITLNRDYLLKALRFGLTTVAIEDELTPLDFHEGGRRMIVSPVRPQAPPAAPEPATPQHPSPNWRGCKKLRAEDLGLKAEDVSGRLISLGHKRLLPRDATAALALIEGRTHAFVEANTFPFLGGLAHFLPNGRLDDVTTRLHELEAGFWAAKADFLRRYAELRESAAAEWRALAEKLVTHPEQLVATIESSFPLPQQMDRCFAFETHQFQVSAPEALQRELITTAEQQVVIHARQRAANEASAKIRRDVEIFVADCVASLREQTATLCQEMLTSIQTSGTGVHQKTLNRLVRFIDQFQQLNFANDTEMARQLATVRTELLTRTAEEYRASGPAGRATLVAGLARLGAEARSLAQQDASELVQRFGSLGQRKFQLAA